MRKRYHIITIGCQMNKSDSERVAAFFENHGYQTASDPRQADIIVLNTCGVRQSAEDRVYGLVNQLRKKNKDAKIVVTGCLGRREDVKQRLNKLADLFLPISSFPDIFQLLAGRLKTSKLNLDEVRLKQGEKYLTILPKYQSKFSAFVPIGNGCNNFCSYCVVPYARGREVYRPVKDILQEVKELLKNGYREIILIAQNVNSYKSGKVDFPTLLEKIVKLKGDFWLRFSTSHPKDVSPKLIKVFGEQAKICPHFHVAVQSGDDKILRAMNRKYTAKHFSDLVTKIRLARPGVSITTDVIVGFPGETKEQFNNTVKLFKQLKFDMAYIARFSPRPQTVATQMKDNVTREEKRRREKVLESVLRQTALENNQKYLNQTVTILVQGINKNSNYYGQTASAKQVVVTGKYQAQKKLVGNFLSVKIKKAQEFSLEAELI